MFIVQWTNKHSGEQGFVKCLHTKDKYFENTFVKDEAKRFKSGAKASILGTLAKYCEQNTYEAVAAE